MTDTHEEMEVDPHGGKDRKLTRGEKSKIAAKGRRDKEHSAMLDLMRELPVSMEVLEKMDKAAVVKLATSYIKIKHFVQKDLAVYGVRPLPEVKSSVNDAPTNNVAKCQEKRLQESQMMLEALNGFLMFVSKKGTMKFVSNTIQDHLGLKQEQLFGKSVFDYIHPKDQQELSKQFNDEQQSSLKISRLLLPADEPRRVFYLRMKFSLPKPNSNAKNTGYMLVQWSGKMKRHISTKLGCVVTDGLLCICRPMQNTPILEIRMDGNMFMSRHDLGMTFTFCDTRIITLTGYEPNELLGKTAYHFHNPIDAPKVQACHQNLIVKGTSISKYYRFLGKTDNWVWLQTRATIIYNTANEAQYIVCMNYVISEEEGEKYLMLEEHQQANQHSDSCVIILPDNPRSLADNRTRITNGPKIIELQEENLEKTACFNGELDNPPSSAPLHPPCGTQQLPTNTMVPEVVFQGNVIGPMPLASQTGPTSLQGSQCIAPSRFTPLSQCQTIMPDQDVPQPVPLVNDDLSDSVSMTTDNATRIDPLIPEYMSHGSPESSGSAYPCSPQPYSGATNLSHAGNQYNNGLIDPAMDNFTHNVAGRCSSSRSDDAGYESANSPYTASYLSPQMVSPACSYDNSADLGYTADMNNHHGIIQGQNCSFEVGYLSDSMNMSNGMAQASQPMDDTNGEYNNPVLDEIFRSINQPTSDNLSVNMALVFSTIESLTSQSTESLFTNVKNPGSPSMSDCSKSTTVGAPVSEKRTDKPLLRSFLTMPQDDIPKQPLGFLQMCKNGGQAKNNVNKVNKSFQNDMDKQMQSSAQKTRNVNQMCCNTMTARNAVSNSVPDSSCGNMENIDNEQLDLSNFPDEFQDFALQNLVNDITDAQAQALIADLQSEGGETLMDTTEFLDSLEDVSQNGVNGDANFSSANNCVSSNIPFSQCKTSLNSTGVNKCNTVPLQHSDTGFSNGPVHLTNCRPSNSAHDHVYHQSMNRLNGQNRQKLNNKAPGNRSQLTNNRLNGRHVPGMCHSQTQTSDHCKSELERHLRNRLKSRGQTCGDNHSMYFNEEKPFLQQLLTGELTNDMYIMMEKRRFEDKPVCRPK